jgi:hypothetical protein
MRRRLFPNDSTTHPRPYRRRLLAFSHSSAQYPHFFSEHSLALGIGFHRPLPATVGTGGDQRAARPAAKVSGHRMRRHAYRQRIVLAAQPARAGRFYRHQVRDSFRAIVLQPGLFRRRKRLKIVCDLLVVRCDEDETFALRTLFEFEQAQHCLAIVRIAAQTITGFSGIGDEAAAFEVGFEATSGDGKTWQSQLSDLSPSPPALLPPAGEGCT